MITIFSNFKLGNGQVSSTKCFTADDKDFISATGEDTDEMKRWEFGVRDGEGREIGKRKPQKSETVVNKYVIPRAYGNYMGQEYILDCT